MPDAAYFSVAEARAFRHGKLSDPAKYPDALIDATRLEIEAAIEERAGHPFVARSRTVVVDGSGTVELALPDIYVTAVTAVTVVETSSTDVYDAAELADLTVNTGYVRRKTLGTFTAGYNNVTVTYTYGESLPAPIKRAALLELVARVIDTDVSERAESRTDETGTVNFAASWPFESPRAKAIVQAYSDNRSYV